MANNIKKGAGMHTTTSLITIALTILGGVLYFLSHTTNYYIFGQMNSGTITALLVCALLVELATLVLVKKFPKALWAKCLTFVVTALLAGSAMMIVGDRVEGIGNCILTDYDSGHGGEEAIYMSLVGAVSLLAAMVYNIIGSFSRDGIAPAGTGKKLGLIISASAIGLAAIIATVMLTGAGIPKSSAVPGGGSSASGTYKITYNLNENNLDSIPDYQFLGKSVGGIMKVEGRLFVDVTLTLDDKGQYKLFSDCYSVEAGKRTTIGDDTGMGQVITTEAEGSYVDNGDGTVTTNVPDHAVFTMQTDTYSAQLKSSVHFAVGEHEEDGVYDSAEYPEVLDFVPETLWNLTDSAIVSYGVPAPRGDYRITFNQEFNNIEDAPDYQFLSADMSSLLNYDSRSYIEITLTLDGVDSYKLVSDYYVLEAGKRAEIGDPSGLGLVYRTTSEGSYSINDEGAVVTAPADHVYFELATDTYSEQMKQLMHVDLGGSDADGNYDSADYPELLDYVPETVWTLSGSEIVSYYNPAADEEAEEAPAEEAPAAEAQSIEIVSDDGGTKLVLFSNGTYKFLFESMGIEDPGTYAFENGVLTVTNANGDVYTADGDPMKLHYVSAVSDQLTGDFTIAADALSFPSADEEQEAGEVNGVEIVSDDGGTTMTFYPSGTYQFYFEAYNISDAGSYVFEDGVLTLTDANGVETSVDGDPIKLHYVYSQNEGLTGDYTIPAESLAFQAAVSEEPAEEAADEEVTGVEIYSDDGNTRIVFYPTGTYEFCFDQYGVSDPGHYEYVDGVLTLTDANGKETSVDGDPLLLHYVYSQNEGLTGDFTIPAESLDFQAAVSEEPAEEAVEEEEKIFSFTAYSDDLGTSISLNSDGTYRFWFAPYEIEDLGTWQIADGVLTLTDANGTESSAEGNPYKLHYAYSQNDQLSGDYTIPVEVFPFPVAGCSIPSTDLGTTISFFADGSYLFAFGPYNIVDTGSYVFEDGVLTLTDANGAESKAEGDPLDLHYVYSQSDQLTGDYAIPAEALVFPEDEIPALTAVSDDHATTITLNGDGTYRFWFAPYEIEDLGIWQIADGVMSLVDANGTETKAEAAPYKLHYAYSQSDQLTGDFTLSVGIFPFLVSGTSIPSDDLGTTITFFTDGSYLFAFDSYEIFDTGSYVFADGVLTITDANGTETRVEGESLQLHYISSMSDQLTGDFSIDPAIFG